jgi:exopolysaccharide biosynthesis polyprenyl glycosylphosphotransferase
VSDATRRLTPGVIESERVETHVGMSARPAEPFPHPRPVPGLPLALALADAVALGGAFFIANATTGPVVGVLGVLLLGLLLLAWLIVANVAGLYSRELKAPDHSTVDEVVQLLAMLSAGAWICAVAILVVSGDPPVSSIAVFWAVAIPLVVGGRSLVRSIVRASGGSRQRAVIVGAGDIGQLVARKLMQHPEYRIEVVGFADDNPKQMRREMARMPVLGSPSELPQIVAAYAINRAIFAFTSDAHESFLDAIRALDGADVEIDVVPRLFEVMTPIADVRTVEGIPLLGFTPRTLSPSGRVVKRIVDIVGSLFVLLLVAPVFALVALAIKLDTRGPVFFRQNRLGRGMVPFTMLKFRTMRTDTDVTIHRDYVKTIMDTNTSPDASSLYKLDQTSHVTMTGRWLRRLSLDELPQFINVLKGDMSLVGPRPCMPYETELFEPHHFVRFSVPAGVTGLWQVTARARTTFKEALDLDVTYVRSWSLGLDLRLLCRTPGKILKGDSTT